MKNGSNVKHFADWEERNTLFLKKDPNTTDPKTLCSKKGISQKIVLGGRLCISGKLFFWDPYFSAWSFCSFHDDLSWIFES